MFVLFWYDAKGIFRAGRYYSDNILIINHQAQLGWIQFVEIDLGVRSFYKTCEMQLQDLCIAVEQPDKEVTRGVKAFLRSPSENHCGIPHTANLEHHKLRLNDISVLVGVM